jgi:hypothetical protein
MSIIFPKAIAAFMLPEVVRDEQGTMVVLFGRALLVVEGWQRTLLKKQTNIAKVTQ